MNKALLPIVACLLFPLSGCAELKEAGRTVGHGTRDVATEIGHASRDAVKAVGETTKKVVDDINDED